MLKRLFLLAAAGLLLSGCASNPVKKDYTQFRTENPRSLLVVPVVNKSVDVDAADYFLSTISKPLGERGYYVYPVNLVKRTLEDDGLSDANLVHSADPRQLAKLFGSDAVLYVTIERWDAQYILVSTTVTVEFSYALKSGRTGETLWSERSKMVYTPQSNSGGSPLGTLIVMAVTAAIEKAKPNYMPLARQANNAAIYTNSRGLPAGPYDPEYGKDKDRF